ncbi:MAG: hypothetical protein R2827_16100 [Bdellovibrionales bacterium]
MRSLINFLLGCSVLFLSPKMGFTMTTQGQKYPKNIFLTKIYENMRADVFRLRCIQELKGHELPVNCFRYTHLRENIENLSGDSPVLSRESLGKTCIVRAQRLQAPVTNFEQIVEELPEDCAAQLKKRHQILLYKANSHSDF